MVHAMSLVLAAVPIGAWAIGGALGAIDLIAATANAFNGALIARRPDHYKHFTVAGVIILAIAGGIGGGVTRDVLLNQVPAPLINPLYLILSTVAAAIAIVIDWNVGQRFRDGLFSFMSSFTLPWYAVVGADKALSAHLPAVAAVLIGVIATTFGRYIIDISCGLPPKQLVRGEFFVGSAALTAIVYIVCHDLGASLVTGTAIAVPIGFGFRLLAQTFGWEELEPWEPADLRAGEAPRRRLGENIEEELAPTSAHRAK